MDEHLLAEIAQTLGELKADIATVKAEIVGYDSTPGLRVRVEDLEASRNKLYGGLGILTFLGGIAEWFFHRKP
jgi:hypothetical protein